MSRLTTDILFRVADRSTFGLAMNTLGLVDELREEAGLVHGTVIHEGVTYRVRVSDDEDFTWSCDCSEPRGDTPCYHAVLIGMAYATGMLYRAWPYRPPRSPLDVSPIPFDHDGLMRRLRTGERGPEDPPLSVQILREVGNGRCHDLCLLFDEALDVFVLPAEEQRPAYLRALHAAAEAVGLFYLNGQPINGEDLYHWVMAYVEETENLIEDPDGAVEAAVSEINYMNESMSE
ncbi:hypothetical protein IDM40_03020 [Nocardiopsis sp. HNM0947]|uniref:SWIM-type domain-containing protein n=1 Tax=Nocardiopsis coralli TaxID=2772213 RepID=A0ABR9P1G6_9ACTN|nr:hypothetical protein [Nocardiopsis coralli]MBE2997682.1 hypothetical protein [Nocardiopsis coralli]